MSITNKESLEELFRSRGPDPWGSGEYVQQRLRASLNFVANHVNKNFAGEFVDVGAFNGAFSLLLKSQFPRCKILVNDITEVALQQARATLKCLPDITFVEADLTELSPPSPASGPRILLLLECLYYIIYGLRSVSQPSSA